MENTIAGIFALIIGSVGAAAGIRNIMYRRTLDSWPTVQGTVSERGVYKPEIPQTSPPAFHYAPLIRYVYEVNEGRYESIDIFPKRMVAPPTNTEKWARKRAGEFPDQVAVHYNPDNPAEAYLEQVRYRWVFVFVGGFLGVALCGILLLLT
ncbi:MAG TPA: DUF3592 domain-containing protein [Pyrinomonadaceae bacterium]|nr:DUF3592 domain-containing protein [Pyrinomonadaceae bacterium]HMP65847.1 DUF3592 domain-containing protein [Pyrinomonadaceae bacterium]